MLLNFFKNSTVTVFGLTVKLGLHRLPGFYQTYLTLYPIYKRYFEAGPIDRLRSFVPAGSVVIDVGANVGFFTLRFADWVGRDGRVIAIEPDLQNFETLVSALSRANLLDHVFAVKAVAADEPGTKYLELNPLHPADHKLSRSHTGVPVTAVTVDDLARDHNGLRPALVKIDVQGAEMLVLRGMNEILDVGSPALFVELSENALQDFGSSVAAVLDLLQGKGYAPYWLTRAGHKTATRTEIHAKVAANDYTDVLFLKSHRNNEP
ncbi:FkbM family methyltransferase [Bradyrhizobium sp. Arg68]|uniref:FkbM family methyltransferase n=1 Tax=Bradyrhizobium ivorense TaxID=2511166 RepID=UPI001E29EE08|nr:FkbM family methyltransferase [Bradyrhizobium ivorense]MCC8936899.1 FkbM family methyltransferase [Bradyrhizobium ivorense]